MDAITAPLISVVIVNYKVPQYVVQAIRSIHEAHQSDTTEIIVVDNASGDDSRTLITRAYPAVRYIGLKANIGFGKACNVGVQNAQGRFVLLLNPDALISHNTLTACCEFLEEHPQVGIVGPKIINPDGSLQSGCRRSFPTPFNSFCHLFGITRIFPKSQRCGSYNLTCRDPDESMEVDAVSGSFMFMRRAVYHEVEGFDEAFFMYGEDLDLCAKVKQRGYHVWYHPATQIVHFGGQSSRQQSFRSRLAFYEAMILFSRKYRNSYGAFFPGWLLAIGIGIQALMHFAALLFSTLQATVIDLLLVNLTLWAGVMARFMHHPLGTPYGPDSLQSMLALHVLLSGIYMGTFVARGVYSLERYSPRNVLYSGLMASGIFFTCMFFVKSFAFSRLAFAIALVATSLVLVGWRILVPRIIRNVRQWAYATGSVVIVGNGPVASQLMRNTESDSSARIQGVVWPLDSNVPGEFNGYPVLGSLKNVGTVLSRNRIDLLLIATTEPWYSFVIEALAACHLRHLTIKWVPSDLLTRPAESLPQTIPLQNFTV